MFEIQSVSQSFACAEANLSPAGEKKENSGMAGDSEVLECVWSVCGCVGYVMGKASLLSSLLCSYHSIHPASGLGRVSVWR